jgi:hypothetical protein
MTKSNKILIGILMVGLIILSGAGGLWTRLALAQTSEEPTAQASPEAPPGVDPETLQSLPPDFDWAAYAEYETRLTKCEMVDSIEWLPGNIKKPVQIQRCIGPSTDIFLQNPDLDSLPQIENPSQPPGIQPAAVEAVPASSK